MQVKYLKLENTKKLRTLNVKTRIQNKNKI